MIDNIVVLVLSLSLLCCLLGAALMYWAIDARLSKLCGSKNKAGVSADGTDTSN